MKRIAVLTCAFLALVSMGACTKNQGSASTGPSEPPASTVASPVQTPAPQLPTVAPSLPANPFTVGEPAKKPARLDGKFEVQYTVVAASKGSPSAPGSAFQRTMVFSPSCSEGPCGGSVVVSDGTDSYTSQFEAVGNAYRFSSSRPATCSVGTVTATYRKVVQVYFVTPVVDGAGAVNDLLGTYDVDVSDPTSNEGNVCPASQLVSMQLVGRKLAT